MYQDIKSTLFSSRITPSHDFAHTKYVHRKMLLGNNFALDLIPLFNGSPAYLFHLCALIITKSCLFVNSKHCIYITLYQDNKKIKKGQF